jgi:hypothetical protein
MGGFMNTTQATPMNAVRVAGKVRKGKLTLKAPLGIPDGDVDVIVTAVPLKFKRLRVYTPEETAQQDCPFPDESEWVDELDKIHAKKAK